MYSPLIIIVFDFFNKNYDCYTVLSFLSFLSFLSIFLTFFCHNDLTSSFIFLNHATLFIPSKNIQINKYDTTMKGSSLFFQRKKVRRFFLGGGGTTQIIGSSQTIWYLPFLNLKCCRIN